MIFLYISHTNQLPQFMKILKYLFFLLLLIIIGSAIYFGTKDGSYNIQDSAIIPAPAEVVFEKVNNFSSWESWSTWKKQDPDLVFNFAEKSSGQGAVLSWEGKKSGSISTVKVIPNREIDQELTYQTPTGERNAKMYWIFEPKGDSTKVIWGTKGTLTLMDKVYNAFKKSDFKKSIHLINKEELNKLADVVVADMKKYSIHVDGVTQYGGGYYMYTTSVAKKQEVAQRSISMMALVQEFIIKNKLHVSGDPFILYNEVDAGNNTVIFSTGFPVRERVITPENSPVVCGFMEPVSAVKTTLKGDYEHIEEATKAGMDYISNNSLEIDPMGKIFEVYNLKLRNQPNPAKRITEIYIPIKSSENTLQPEM